jgi:hypothetical protein
MSHFSVLVIGKNVDDQLAPFHEFECTGEDNEYVQDIDITDETRKSFETETTTRFKDPDGNLHNLFTPEGDWDERFVREFTPEEMKEHGGGIMGSGGNGKISWSSRDWNDGRGYRAKIVHVLPEGWTEVEVPKKDVETFADFVKDWHGKEIVPFGEIPDLAGEHKYGYALVDEKGEITKVIDRTNPEKKWDWYQVGGRWNGFFKVKPMAVGVLGTAGLQTMNKDYEPPSEDRADVVLKCDVDWDGMRDEAGEEAGKRYDKVIAVLGGRPTHQTWEEIKVKNRTGEFDADGEPSVDYGKARDEYNAQPEVKLLRSNDETVWEEADNFLCTREEFVARARNGAIATFAVVKDGKWYERGEMGWWGVVHDEKDRNEWVNQFAALIDGLPEDTLLSVVDCHI